MLFIGYGLPGAVLRVGALLDGEGPQAQGFGVDWQACAQSVGW